MSCIIRCRMPDRRNSAAQQTHGTVRAHYPKKTAHLVFDLRAVRIRVEHDDCIRQHVGHIRGRKDARIAAAELLAECLHDAVNLLGLAGQAKPLEEESQRILKGETGKVHIVDVCKQDLRVSRLQNGNGKRAHAADAQIEENTHS